MQTLSTEIATTTNTLLRKSETVPTLCIPRGQLLWPWVLITYQHIFIFVALQVVDSQNSIDGDDRTGDYRHMPVRLLSIHPLKGDGVCMVEMAWDRMLVGLSVQDLKSVGVMLVWLYYLCWQGRIV